MRTLRFASVTKGICSPERRARRACACGYAALVVLGKEDLVGKFLLKGSGREECWRVTIPHRPAVMLPLWEWKTPYTMGAADYVRIPGEIPPRTVWVATKVVLMRTYDGK